MNTWFCVAGTILRTCGRGRKAVKVSAFLGARVNAPRFAWHLQSAGTSDPGPLSVSTETGLLCVSLGHERQAVHGNAFEVRL